MNEHLSQISTRWTVLFQAQDMANADIEAQQALLVRYCGAIYGYLLRVVGDKNVADDLAQEFALRFVQGKFHNANPERGRFRDYIKTCLWNLVREHFRKSKKEEAQPFVEENQVDEGTGDMEFAEDWRDEILTKTWESLAEDERHRGHYYFTTLDQRTRFPEQSSQELAESLSAKLEKSITAATARQMLHRSRDLFAELLLDEVRRSLKTNDWSVVEDELSELQLLPYCRDALAKRKA